MTLRRGPRIGIEERLSSEKGKRVQLRMITSRGSSGNRVSRERGGRPVAAAGNSIYALPLRPEYQIPRFGDAAAAASLDLRPVAALTPPSPAAIPSSTSRHARIDGQSHSGCRWSLSGRAQGRVVGQLHGFRMSTPRSTQSRSFLVTKTRSCTFAVPSSSPSMGDSGRPRRRASADSCPHALAIASSTGKTRPTKARRSSCVIHRRSSSCRGAGASSTPAVISPMVSTLIHRSNVDCARSHCSTIASGVFLICSETTFVSSRNCT